MKSITHAEFLQKFAECKVIADDYAVSKSYGATANTFEMFPIAVVSAVRYFDRHKNDPMQPVFGLCKHQDCCDIARVFKLSDMDSMQSKLIRDFPSLPDSGYVRKDHLSRRLLRVVMKNSGLTWFDNGRGEPVIHWKHQNL